MTHPEREEVTAQIEAAKQHDTYRTPAEAELAESEAELSALMDVFNDQAGNLETAHDLLAETAAKLVTAEATIERLRALLRRVEPELLPNFDSGDALRKRIGLGESDAADLIRGIRTALTGKEQE